MKNGTYMFGLHRNSRVNASALQSVAAGGPGYLLAFPFVVLLSALLIIACRAGAETALDLQLLGVVDAPRVRLRDKSSLSLAAHPVERYPRFLKTRCMRRLSSHP